MLMDAFFPGGFVEDFDVGDIEDIVLPELTKGVKIFRGIPVQN